ncbi:hypothetical protein [Pseudomonas sp. LFM046]|uniref:hypothetical protein n=1 Tax=Pseudomonas sp. LFM046 TaxID=1608357 RepID=UPI0011AF2F72|nr:hypothetical protein [Pseudomonas sp. LFM046]
MKSLIFLAYVVLLIFSVHVNAERFEVRCFTSLKNDGTPINIKFSTMFVASDGYRIGYVVYEKPNKPILLYYSGRTERVFEEDRPFEVTTKWKEIIEGKPAGEYTIISQGAIVYGFSYKTKAGEVFDFSYNSKATHAGQGGCNWNGGL